MQQTCPQCGAFLRPTARFCGTCGYIVAAQTILPSTLTPVAAVGKQPYLLAVSGQQHLLSEQVTRIGRGLRCELQLTDGSVSSIHAEIEVQGAGSVVRDLGSTNGTYVNKLKITGETPLHDGDQVAFGEAAFTFRDGMSAAAGVPKTRAMGAPDPLLVPAVPNPLGLSMASPAAVLPALRDWGNRPPVVEGRIVHVDGPHKEQRGSAAQTALAAGCMAILYAPLAFIPFLFTRDVSVYYLRVEDVITGQLRSVKIRGEPSGMVSQGDVAAFWGRVDGGTLLAKSAYNYTTDAFVKVK